ncbi:ATP-binding cassette domain-containing protein [Desulfovibrio sp. OttesenSCG-928-G11]|nr:ATP-binding cassette domain-containing protein [Desulfovibrio sp. OttesenSCG-928-G11]
MNGSEKTCSPPAAAGEATPLVELRGLCRYFVQGGSFGGKRKLLRAVEDVSLYVLPGETLGIVGESGCGKSTLGRMTVGLLPPSAGEVFIKGLPLWDGSAHADYRAFRQSLAGVVQMVFQDPYSSLNPRMRIGASIAEPLLCSCAWHAGQKKPGRAVIEDRVARLLRGVGLEPEAAGRYPHEFSGGQRQRIAIARVLATDPAFVVCDEPTSSLDASVQSQVLNLLRDMQDELGLAYLFISHDLDVVRHMSDRAAVMYLGHVLESGNSDDIFSAPLHPYTRLLLEAGPEGADSAPAYDNLDALSSAALYDGPGCPFAPRCPERMERCLKELPLLAAPQAAPDGPERPERPERLTRCFLFSG